jgi:hypothetical protein
MVVTHAGAVLIKPETPGVEVAESLAPEQLRGEAPDSSSDVFAVGALLRWNPPSYRSLR